MAASVGQVLAASHVDVVDHKCCQCHHAKDASVRAACGFASMVACAVALWKLRAAPSRVRKRLFWSQLVVLTVVDMLSGFLHQMEQLEWLLGDSVSATQLIYMFHTPLDLTSAFMEMHIAAGFAAASRGSVQSTVFLRRLIPSGVLFGVVMGPVLTYGSHAGPWCNQFGMQTLEFHFGWGHYWAIFITVLSAFAVFFYMIGLTLACGAPSWLRSHAMLRAVSYASNFGITTVPALVIIWGGVQDYWWNWASWHLWACNGLFNASVYLYWLRRDSTTKMPDEVADLEESILYRYFDLSGNSDEDVRDAERAVALAVAQAQIWRKEAPEALPPDIPP